MFEAIGRFAYRFRWLIIGIWIVMFGVSVAATPFLEGVLTGGFSNPESPSQVASGLIEEKFAQGPTTLVVVFKSDTLEATSELFQAAEKASLDELEKANIPNLESIQTYSNTGSELMLSKDRHSSAAVLSFSASDQEVQSQLKTIRRALRSVALETYVTGEPAVFADISSYSFRDLRKVELYGLPVALLALIFVFGSLVAAAMPVITGGLAVTVTLGWMYLIARATSMSIFSMNVATLLGLAVAIDYALFVVWRFREELHRGASVEEAVVVTTARAGRSIFYSGAAVMVGVVGLIFFPSPGLRSLGIGGALVVFFSVAATVTFMPAILAVLGRRIDSIPVIKLQGAHDGRLWKGWARTVLRRPWLSILVVVVLVALLAGPAITMKTQMTSAIALPPEAEARQGLTILDEEFDRQQLSPTLVLLTWDGDSKIDMARAAAFFMYGQQLATVEGVSSVQSPFTIAGLDDPMAMAELWPQFEGLLNDPDGFVVPDEGITLDSGLTITHEQLEQFKQLIKSTVAPGALLYRVVAEDGLSTIQTDELVGRLMGSEPPSGYSAYVGGEAAFSHDFTKELDTWFPWVIVWIVFTTLIVFVLLLRSVVLPVLAVVINLATIAMSMGILVLIFQGDTFAGFLRFTATGAIDAVDRVLMVCILFGITMDYAVFMLTRMHERWHRSKDPREAVAVGLVRSGRIIVSAALLVVIVTGAFAFTSISTTKVLGLGIALAIIVDAVLIRLVLLPSVMAYLGKASWWWPSRKKGRVGLLDKQPEELEDPT